MRISDWSSDVCSSDLGEELLHVAEVADRHADLADLALGERVVAVVAGLRRQVEGDGEPGLPARQVLAVERVGGLGRRVAGIGADQPGLVALGCRCLLAAVFAHRSAEHTSGLQSLMRLSYAVFCLNKKYATSTMRAQPPAS